LFASERAQFQVGAASQQDLLTEQLTLLQAEQNLNDTQGLLTQGSVALIKNLGGGWQWGAGDAKAGAAKPADAKAGDVKASAATGGAAPSDRGVSAANLDDTSLK
jgi:hypothetical protein